MLYYKIIGNIIYIAIQSEYIDDNKFNIKYIIKNLYIYI